jgi:transposase
MAQDLTDAQWAFIEPLLPELPKRRDGRGRPWRDSREVLNGILWILRTGAQWSEMPNRYPPYQTCHRRFQHWRASGVMDRLLVVLAQDLERRGKVNLEECFIDGSFSAAKKGALGLGKPSGARVPRSWQLQTALVFLSPYAQGALRRMKRNSSRN